jgi:hypothetical protein
VTIAPPPYLPSADFVRTLVEATARVVAPSRSLAPAQSSPIANTDLDEHLSLPLERAHELDADKVAAWVVRQYEGRAYPGVVMGSRHGAAIHLAAALGMPWLPSGFEVDVDWRGGNATDATAAMEYGNAAGVSVLSVNHDLSVRQVHDPVGVGAVAGFQVNLQLRWRGLPAAYQTFLDSHVDRGGSVFVIGDARAWPVLDLGGDCSFQVGSAATGLTYEDYLSGPDLRAVACRTGGVWRAPEATWRPGQGEHGVEFGLDAAVRRWARTNDALVYSASYHSSEVLSAAVADLYRGWLRENGFRGDHLIVETGRRLEAARVLHTGMVPYWCESGTRAAVTEAELWVAASSQFNSIDVLDEPVGRASSRLATTAQWTALTGFAIRPSEVDQGLMGALVLRRLSSRQPRHPLGDQFGDGVRPDTMTPAAAIKGLRASGPGLRVSRAGD